MGQRPVPQCPAAAPDASRLATTQECQQPAWRHTNALAAGLVAASYEYTTLAMNLVHAMAPCSIRSHEHEVWAWACIALRGGACIGCWDTLPLCLSDRMAVV